MFTIVAPYIDFFTRSFSLGLDHYWRKRAVSLSGIKEGDRVLDLCSGTGELAFILADQVGKTGLVTGIDFCDNMITFAKKKKSDEYLNITFLSGDAKNVPFPDNSFDAVTVAFGMRNIPNTLSALQEIQRVLRPGGKFMCLELTQPENPWFLKIYRWYVFKIMPFISRLIMKTAAPFQYLPRSIQEFYQPETFKDIISSNGFSNITVRSITLGVATVYKAEKT